MFRYSLNQIDPLLSLNLAFHNLYEAENHVPLFNPLSEKGFQYVFSTFFGKLGTT